MILSLTLSQNDNLGISINYRSREFSPSDEAGKFLYLFMNWEDSSQKYPASIGSSFRSVQLMDSCRQPYRFYFSDGFSFNELIEQDYC